MSISNKKFRTLSFLIIVALPLLTANIFDSALSADIFTFGIFKDTERLSEDYLKIIERHREWLKAYENNEYSFEAYCDKRRAVLASADLRYADLTGADLRYADLTGADLWCACLSKAKLNGANLTGSCLRGAYLDGADLSKSILNSADLSDAKLWGADLTEAELIVANLSGAELDGSKLCNAKLWGADLSSVKMIGNDLSGADFRWNNPTEKTNMKWVVFEPNKPSDIDSISFAANLDLMKYNTTPQELIKLRNAFKNGGFYRQEKEIVYAIKHCETLNKLHNVEWLYSVLKIFKNRVEWLLNYLNKLRPHDFLYKLVNMFLDVERLYEWLKEFLERDCPYDKPEFLVGIFYLTAYEFTTEWGLAPWNALMMLLKLILLFAIFYVYALKRKRSGVNGIYLKWTDDCIQPGLGIAKPIKLGVDWPRAVIFGLYFSVLSAFSIGWREFNVSDWIQRVQSKEYTLRATGWVRVISGIQALISTYLLAIWALTYSSRPFE
jgi:hypothetical protein